MSTSSHLVSFANETNLVITSLSTAQIASFAKIRRCIHCKYKPFSLIMSPSRIGAYPTYRIASIPADGIGPEVIDAGVTVLEKLASRLKTFKLEFENFDWSSDYYKKHRKYLPKDALVTLKKFDAILFGAVGAPGKVPNIDRIAVYKLTP